MKASSILGLNARSQLFLAPFNPTKSKRIADSKLIMYKTLKKEGIPTPGVYAKFKEPKDVLDFDWHSLPESFALKPSRGFGGEGIIVVKKRSKKEFGWITTQKTLVTPEDLKLNVLDILEGAYSLGNIPDVAFIQEYVGRHKTFRRYAYRGTPDIRIIVFNKVPVMAMLRLPTKESGGRANLHQGAIGVGIDMATGITTKALWHGQMIKFKPDTQRKLNGLKIPTWTKILEIAVGAAISSGLGYGGVDMVIHPEKGPMVLEINARPGLQIQMANQAGLKKRLERVEDLLVRDAEHGVKIAKALFAGRFVDRVRADEGVKTIKAVEEIEVKTGNGEYQKVLAKIDTGAWSSAVDIDFARQIGIYSKGQVLWKRKKLSALGEEERPVIPMTFWLAGRKIKTDVTVADRSELRYQVLIGRVDLAGFLISAEIDKDKLKEAKW